MNIAIAYTTFRYNLLSEQLAAADTQLKENPHLLWGTYGEELRNAPLPPGSIEWLKTRGVDSINVTRWLSSTSMDEVGKFHARLSVTQKFELFLYNVRGQGSDEVIRFLYPEWGGATIYYSYYNNNYYDCYYLLLLLSLLLLLLLTARLIHISPPAPCIWPTWAQSAAAALARHAPPPRSPCTANTASKKNAARPRTCPAAC
jgi:hypothetical protein